MDACLYRCMTQLQLSLASILKGRRRKGYIKTRLFLPRKDLYSSQPSIIPLHSFGRKGAIGLRQGNRGKGVNRDCNSIEVPITLPVSLILKHLCICFARCSSLYETHIMLWGLQLCHDVITRTHFLYKDNLLLLYSYKKFTEKAVKRASHVVSE